MVCSNISGSLTSKWVENTKSSGFVEFTLWREGARIYSRSRVMST